MSFIKEYNWTIDNTTLRPQNFYVKDFDTELIYFGNFTSPNSGFISKADINGSVIWTKRIGENSILTKIVKCDNGDYITLGYDHSQGTNNAVPIIIRFNSSDGNIIWQKRFDNVVTQTFKLESLIKLSADTYFIFFQDLNLFIKIDGSGGIIKSVSPSNNFGYIQSIDYADNEVLLLQSHENPVHIALLRLNENLDIVSNTLFQFNNDHFPNTFVHFATFALKKINSYYILTGVIASRRFFIKYFDGLLNAPASVIKISTSGDITPSVLSRNIHVISDSHIVIGDSDSYNKGEIIYLNHDFNSLNSEDLKLDGRNFRSFRVREYKNNKYYLMKYSSTLAVIPSTFNLKNHCLDTIHTHEPLNLVDSNFSTSLGSVNIETYPLTSNNASLGIHDVASTIEVICQSNSPNYDLEKSTINANPTTINANGTDSSLITVQLKDSLGNNITTGGETVVITQSSGNLTPVPATDNNNGTYTANLTSTVEGSTLLKFTVNGQNTSNTKTVSFTKVSVECEAHIALVVDESGSIDSTEAAQIKVGLQSFIDTQLGSSFYISLIGMSQRDTDSRNDHILYQKVSTTTKVTFDNWITEYRNRGISGAADYWASGLEVVQQLSDVPDIVVIITDGLQIENAQTMLNRMLNINNLSHIFVYGLSQGYYNNGQGRYVNLIPSLAYYLGRTPIESTTNNDLLVTDYVNIQNFSALSSALSGLSQSLIDSEVGCGNIEIIENSTTAATLKLNETLNGLSVGSLKVKNDKSTAHTIANGIKIASINGITFSTSFEVVVPPNGSEANVPVRINGTPTSEGTFNQVIAISGVLNPQQFEVNYIAEDIFKEVSIKEITSLQSPNFYLQSVGSKGIESTKGMHLRWIFSGALGEKHLPKGNLATPPYVNFNKTDDFVKVYRAKYQKFQFTLNLFEPPTTVDDTNRLWVYRFANNREFYVYFRNTTKYNQVRAAINPLSNPSGFFQSYDNELIEVENKKELFFAIELKATNIVSGSSVQTESLSVSENTLLALKGISNRQTFTSSELNAIRLVCENGRGIRFKPSNCQVSEIHFEFYADFIATVNKGNGWQPLGDYGLTLDNNQAYSFLEPAPGLVHGHWQRFNDNAYVNIDNYKTKWNRPTEPWDRNIKQIVNNYIELSNVASNPTAIEAVPFENDDDNPLEISNLDQLNFAAYDYHIARMLGLGFLDVDTAIYEDTYVYIAEYTTFGDLKDGLGKREVHHLSMGLPTSINDERLPIPVDIKEIKPGTFLGNEGEAVNLTDDDGYTHNGEFRYVTLYNERLPNDLITVPFYHTVNEFALAQFTYPIYAGIEYQHSNNPINEYHSHVWQKPELPNDIEYKNAVSSGEAEHNETRVLQIPDANKPLYVHKQDRNNYHYYSSYGINWFSRATSSNVIRSIQTQLQPNNPLLPPSNINPLLIRKERPLLLTSGEEQERLDYISGDKTLIRITFDYHTYQDMIIRKIPLNTTITNNQILDSTNANDIAIFYPDNEEILAEEVDIFFRDQVPNNISGKVISVVNHPSSNVLSNIQTGDYFMSSVGETISPIFAPDTEDNYIGGSFVLGNQQHIIHNVVQGTKGPLFSVYKKEISDALINDIPSADADNLQPIEITGDGFFMAIENMQNASSWGTPNPLPLKVNVAVNNQIHREIIETLDDDGNLERQIEKSRGVWSDPLQGHTTIDKINEPYEPIYDPDGNITGNKERHRGTYKITFHGVQLQQHPQYNDSGVSVEWFRGFARVFTDSSIQGNTARKTRKIIPVIKIENIGTANDLVIYINDASFSPDSGYDAIKTGNNISVNFYPSYKVYLYNDNSYGLNEGTLLPNQGEGTRYAIFGLRSRDLDLQHYTSKISIPSLMFAQEMIEALPPEQPKGALYATRPDFFGRSTYTLTTTYKHQPHGLLFYRSNDEALLNALYEKPTVIEIRETLKALGGNEEDYFTNRWQNFLNFEELENDGDYKMYPPENEEEDPDKRFKFPNPDKQAVFNWANDVLGRLGQPLITETPGALTVSHPKIINFVKGAIYNAFVPLTEVPIIYQHIKGGDYKPVNEKQVIRDRNGYVLSPMDEDFKMAPMMKAVGTNPNETQFVDFNLDGTSNNIYFYGVREVSSQMKMGDYSPFLGPVKLVNTNAPEAPEVKRIMPVLENIVLGTPPSIQLEINAYPEVQNIKKLTIYRAFNKLDAQSVRTMQMVKVIDLESEGIINEAIWKVFDTFDDLIEVPYGDGLFYRITISRKVEYANKEGNVVIKYQPSQASKIVATMMVEVANPLTPILDFSADNLTEDCSVLPNITLKWDKTCYNGKYHIYKMNNQGNWLKIHELQSRLDTIILPLADTDLENGTLQILDSNYNPIYHHFKVVAENTLGMLSANDEIKTLVTNPDDFKGIGCLVIGSTFIVD